MADHLGICADTILRVAILHKTRRIRGTAISCSAELSSSSDAFIILPRSCLIIYRLHGYSDISSHKVPSWLVCTMSSPLMSIHP